MRLSLFLMGQKGAIRDFSACDVKRKNENTWFGGRKGLPRGPVAEVFVMFPRTPDEDEGKRERWEEEALLGSSPKARQSLAFHDWRVGH